MTSCLALQNLVISFNTQIKCIINKKDQFICFQIKVFVTWSINYMTRNDIIIICSSINISDAKQYLQKFLTVYLISNIYM